MSLQVIEALLENGIWSWLSLTADSMTHAGSQQTRAL